MTQTYLVLLSIIFVIFVWYMFDHNRVMRRYGCLIRQYERFECGDSKDNLFIKYGGLQTVMTVVDTAVTNLLADASLAPVFAVVGQDGHRSGAQLKSLLDLQFTYLLGGPLLYPGRSITRGVTVDGRTMKASHAGLTITRDQFNTFNSILVNTFLQCGVSQEDVNELTPALNAMASDIITVAS